MLGALRQTWVQIALTLLVLALFLGHAAGLFEVVMDFGTRAEGSMAVFRSPEFLTLLAVGIVLAALLPVLPPIFASLLTIVAAGPVFWMNYASPTARPLVPMEYSLLTILILFTVSVLLAYVRESRRRGEILDVFGQYVPPQVVDVIGRDPQGFSLEGQSRTVTVMFCDVRDFTSISEHLEPRDLARMLNTLFTPLTEIIHRHRGCIDKYMGDAVMAFWGAPMDDPDHAANAVAAAFAIQEAVAELSPRFQARGWPPIRVGIGVNTGVVSAGNMGSKYRVAYTVVGDAVNLAARLQDLTRVYRANIIAGTSTRKAFPAVSYRELGLVRVKGKNRLERIYEPCNPSLDLESTIIANMNRHNEALRCYYARQWDVAERLFRLLKTSQPDDPLYDYYLERVAEFRGDPPPEDWRGEIRFTVK